MSHRFIRSLAGLVVSAAVLAGCAASGAEKGSSATSADSSAGADRAVTIGLTYIPNVQFAPFYVAAQDQLFRWDNGGGERLQPVHLRHHGADEGLFNALLSHKEDYVVAFADEAVQAISAGMDLCVTGILYQKYPVEVIATKQSGITSWADLKGKTVGVPGRFGSSWFGFQAGLQQAGLSLEDVNISEIGYTQQTQMATGKVDAVVGFSNNDLVQFQLAGLEVTEIPLPPNLPLVGAAVVTTGEQCENQDAATEGVINAMAQAINSIQQDPEKAVEYTKKYDQTLNTAASLQAAQKVNLATLELEHLPNYDPADPGRAAAPDPQKFKAMIALLGQVGALDDKVDLSSLDQAGLEKIARPWQSLHAKSSATK